MCCALAITSVSRGLCLPRDLGLLATNHRASQLKVINADLAAAMAALGDTLLDVVPCQFAAAAALLSVAAGGHPGVVTEMLHCCAVSEAVVSAAAAAAVAVGGVAFVPTPQYFLDLLQQSAAVICLRDSDKERLWILELLSYAVADRYD